MPDLPAHIEEALNNLESPFATPDEKGKADAKLRAILAAAWGLLDEGRPTDWGRRGCAHCSAWNNEKCDTDCPHRKLKEAMQEPCQRCGGEGKEERAIVDFSSATQTEPCPDCNLSDDQ